MSDPLISVVMSVYNGEKYLREAVDSILSQTYRSIEFIIVDDGSTDRTRKILKSYKDDRLVLIHQKNAGQTRALNCGIAVAKGEFIARQDADDVSKPQRLEMQLAFMRSNPRVGLLGTRFEFIDEDGKVVRLGRLPLENKMLQARLPQINQFCHASVLIRKEALDRVGSYREFFKYSQDYDLWLRISEQFEIANLEAPLCSYRELDTAISSEKILLQSRYAAVAAEMARQRRISGTDDIQQGREPRLLSGENFSNSLQKKMSTFYCQNPVKLLSSLKQSDEKDFPFFFEMICNERLQYENELQEKNEQLRKRNEIENGIASLLKSANDHQQMLTRLCSQVEAELKQKKEQLFQAEGLYEKKSQELQDKEVQHLAIAEQWSKEQLRLKDELAQKDEVIRRDAELLEEKDRRVAATDAELAALKESTAEEKRLQEVALSQRDQDNREKAELISQMQCQLAEYLTEINSRNEAIQRLQTSFNDAERRNQEQSRLTDEKLRHANQQTQELEQLLLRKDEALQGLKADILAKSEGLKELQEKLGRTEEELAAVTFSYEMQVREKDQQIEAFLNSRSWQVTSPLRAVADIFSKK